MLKLKTISHNNLTTPAALRVYLRDPVNSVNVIPDPSSMEADPVVISLVPDTSLWVYKIKTSRSFHVKGDPLLDCTDYCKDFTYNDCVQEDMIKTALEHLGCVPPFFAKDSKDICNTVLNATSHTKDLVDSIFQRYFLLGQKPFTCQLPCTQTVYETKLVYKTPIASHMVALTFSPLVSVTRSSFRLSSQSLVSNLGGSVSSGRTLLWGILTLLTG